MSTKWIDCLSAQAVRLSEIHTMQRIMENVGNDKMAIVVCERKYVDDDLSSASTATKAVQ